MESFKLEKGKKYKLSHCDDALEGEFMGVLRKSCGTHHHNRLVFKTGENSYWTGEADTKIMEDGTIRIIYDVYNFARSLEDLVKPEVRPKETREIL